MACTTQPSTLQRSCNRIWRFRFAISAAKRRRRPLLLYVADGYDGMLRDLGAIPLNMNGLELPPR
jgi:hypothetical protein